MAGSTLQIAIPIFDRLTALDAVGPYEVHETTMYTTSVCTGSLLLASAGLLNGLDAATHWTAHKMLEKFGARASKERVVQQGKIITAAGVSSGIDMALRLASELADEKTAKGVQLIVEYDPEPPFQCGSVEKAGPEIVNKARELMTSTEST